jgi:hypothetical protein
MTKKNKRSGDEHTWRFFRAGGFDQVRLDSSQDLLSLEKLDKKLWVALACPIDNVFFDVRTLSLIDTNNDRRIRADELIAAIKWTASLLKNPDDLTAGVQDFTLQTINDATDEGKALAAAMRRALSALGKNETDAVSIVDFESLEKVLAQKPHNGDGIITEEAAADDAVRSVIKDIIATLGAVADRSGKPGINAEKVESFFAQARDHAAWFAESGRDKALLPLGDATEEAALAIAAVRDKINDYFARCAIAAFDERAIHTLNGGEKPFEAFSAKTLSMESDEIAALPLTQVRPLQPLSLKEGLNPAWVEKIRQFETVAVRPLLGNKEALSESEWRKMIAAFAPHSAWLQRKPKTALDAMGISRLRDLQTGIVQKTLLGLIELDKAEAATFESLLGLEKLARFRRDIHSLCTNFVNFKDFYAKGGLAIFKAGTLYLDQRSCDLCIKVDDVVKHSLMSAMAGTYIVYCECRRRAGTERMNILAAFTNGDSDNLLVGRNGVFYDRLGNDWDATITRIIENPISLRQAFWLPYKSFVRMIETQVAKRASAAEAQSTARLEQTAAATATADKSMSQPAPAPKKLDIGVVAALGVAAGALGTFIATLMGYTSGIIRMGPLAIIGAFIGLLLVISGPSLILAYIKLRKRNLGPILDAGGWAINAKARINVPFGTVLTHVAALPPGSQRDLTDPYAEKKSPWPKVAVLAVLLYIAYVALNHFGYVNEWTGGRIGMKRVHKENTQVIEQKSPATVPELKQ